MGGHLSLGHRLRFLALFSLFCFCYYSGRWHRVGLSLRSFCFCSFSFSRRGCPAHALREISLSTFYNTRVKSKMTDTAEMIVDVSMVGLKT